LKIVNSGATIQGDRGEYTAAATGRWEVISFTRLPAFEQEGFRFRDDNVSESGAWDTDVGQDINITRSINLNTRLRFLVDTTGDPAAQQFQIEYKKPADGVWNKVLTAQPSTSLPTYVAT
jgi:hypothetical protein